MAIASGLTLLEMKFFLKITSYLGKIAQRFRQTLTGKCFCNKQGQKCKVSKISFEKICNGLYCLSIYLENLYRYIYVNSCLSSLYVSLRYSQQLITVNARIQNFSLQFFLGTVILCYYCFPSIQPTQVNFLETYGWFSLFEL